MYSSKISGNFQWHQAYPLDSCQDDRQQRIYCNGKPCKKRNWRSSRESHRNAAQQWSTCTAQLLLGLPESFTIFKGCISFPNASPDQWRILKRKIYDWRYKLYKKHGCEFSIVAKQHITPRTNGMHFDYIGYTDLKLSERQLRECFLHAVDLAGGKRSSSALKIVADRSRQNVERLASYNFKFATGREQVANFMGRFPLPATNFPATWCLGNFWRRKSETVSLQRYWNDELQTVAKKLSPMQLVWRETLPPDIPKFTTAEYRSARKVERAFDGNCVIKAMPLTADDWKATLSLATVHSGGTLFAPIISSGVKTDGILIEAGEPVWNLQDRLKGLKPRLQRIVDQEQADKIRQEVFPPIKSAGKFTDCTPRTEKPSPRNDENVLTDAEFLAEMASA